MRAADRLFVLLAGTLIVVALQAPRPTAEGSGRPRLSVTPLTTFEIVRSAALDRGETLSQLLRSLGLGAEVLHWVDAAGRQLDLRSLPVGLAAEAVLDHHERVKAIRLTPDWRSVIVLETGRHGIVVRREARPVERELVVVDGSVSSSLFEAIDVAGEKDALALALADLFQWDVDFHREVRQGDRFTLLVERVSSDGEVVDYGPIVTATYINAGRTISAVRYATADGRTGYYDDQGRPLRKQFLRAPLRLSRITSRFSSSRLHPVLGRRMPHYGVDYGAPAGTPVMATADGTVTFRGWKEGGGNTVELRHRNGYTTGYLHLSRFARGLRVGSRVSQGQLIGYVGATGLATGPHLDYRITRNGRYTNPLTVGNDPAPPLPREELGRFSSWAEQVLPLLGHPGRLADETREALQAVSPVPLNA